ncbi:hypothetical protein QZH41_016320 [Actinostola sp. cb2023]|nr:hypothetical protein QZH41_016320 [Actinostola sp. cb2023]
MADEQSIVIGDVEEEIKGLEQHGEAMEQFHEETEKAIELLTTGIMSAFLPEMDNMKARVLELTYSLG